jgi:hypothetical protein
MKRIEAGQLADPARALPPDVAGWAGVLQRALAPDAVHRFADAGAMLDAMERAVATPLPIVAPRVPTAPRHAPPAQAGAEAPAPATGGAFLMDAAGRRHVLNAPRVVVGALRGNVEVLDGPAPHYSHVVLERVGRDWRVVVRSRLDVTIDGKAVRGEALLRGGESLVVNGYQFSYVQG